MTAVTKHNAIVNGYLGLLENLSPNDKLDLISRLTISVKTDLRNKKRKFKKAFGALDIDKTAEELIEEIRNNRTFNRQIESF
jgi:hypothetical protein